MSMKYYRGEYGLEFTDKYVFFWGSCFSQWAHSPFSIKGVMYENAEQWMMYNKAVHFKDFEIAKKIMEISDPEQIKALGRKVRNFDENSWASVAYDIVVQGNIAKFSQNPEMHRHLMRTQDLEIVEASPYDKIWGIGLGTHDSRRHFKEKWQGQNLLGKALMDVRSHFEDLNKW